MTSDHAQQVRVEEISWTTILPIVRLFEAFRTAICLPNLLIALLLIVTLWGLGHTLDGALGFRAYQGEIAQYTHLSSQSYDHWLEEASQNNTPQIGVFDAAVTFKLRALRGLAINTLTVLGAAGPTSGRPAIVGNLHDLFVTLPRWLWNHHRGFLLLYGSIGLAIWALLGGAIARSSAVKATQNRAVTTIDALRYAKAQWTQFFLTPLLPFILASMVAVIPVVFGALLFNLPGLDLMGGLVMIVPIVCSGIIALFIVLAIIASPLLYPALAIESTDCFDALSRAFGYVLGRPWQWLSYNLVIWVFGAATYFLIGALICLTLAVTHICLDVGVVRETGIDQLEAIFASHRTAPSLGNEEVTDLDLLSKLTVGAGSLWVYVLTTMLSAYAVSFYFSANTWIYLLLRRSVDKSDLDDLFVEITETTAASSEPSSNEST